MGRADGNSAGVKRPYIYNVAPNGGGDTFARAIPGSGTFSQYESRALSTMSKALVPTSAFDRHQTYIKNYMANYGEELFSLRLALSFRC